MDGCVKDLSNLIFEIGVSCSPPLPGAAAENWRKTSVLYMSASNSKTKKNFEFLFKDYESKGIPEHLVINSMYKLYSKCCFFVTLPTGAILYARVILCALLSICRSKILVSYWVFSKYFPHNPPWKWEHRLGFKLASRIRFYCLRNFAVNYWQNTDQRKKSQIWKMFILQF